MAELRENEIHMSSYYVDTMEEAQELLRMTKESMDIICKKDGPFKGRVFGAQHDEWITGDGNTYYVDFTFWSLPEYDTYGCSHGATFYEPAEDMEVNIHGARTIEDFKEVFIEAWKMAASEEYKDYPFEWEDDYINDESDIREYEEALDLDRWSYEADR